MSDFLLENGNKYLRTLVYGVLLETLYGKRKK